MFHTRPNLIHYSLSCFGHRENILIENTVMRNISQATTTITRNDGFINRFYGNIVAVVNINYQWKLYYNNCNEVQLPWIGIHIVSSIRLQHIEDKNDLTCYRILRFNFFFFFIFKLKYFKYQRIFYYFKIILCSVQ